MLVARFCSAGFEAELVRRRGWDEMWAESNTDVFYVVGRGHDALMVQGAPPSFVQPGLLTIKIGEGQNHPLIRAICGADDPLPTTILDITTGLGGDAQHVAAALPDAQILACEGSVLVHALLEEGLPRLATDPRFGPAAARIALVPVATDHLIHLRSLPDGAVDVVMMDPMMPRPLKAQPSFSAVRRFAVATPMTDDVIVEARRVARRRVVFKRARGSSPEVDLARLGFGHVVYGTMLAYQVAERAS